VDQALETKALQENCKGAISCFAAQRSRPQGRSTDTLPRFRSPGLTVSVGDFKSSARPAIIATSIFFRRSRSAGRPPPSRFAGANGGLASGLPEGKNHFGTG